MSRDLTGMKINRLTVLGLSAEPSTWSRKWDCVCECGTTVAVAQTDLVRARTQSCGCARRAKDSLRKSHAAEYSAWGSMKFRCSAKATGELRIYYFDRGIRVCDKWASDFEAFLSDIGPRPSAKHSLDRLDANGHYEPGNVRWATKTEQTGNRRVTLRAMFRGSFTPIADIARTLSTPYWRVNVWATKGKDLPGTELAGVRPVLQQQERYPLAYHPVVGATFAAPDCHWNIIGEAP